MSKTLENIGRVLLDHRFGWAVLILASLGPLVGIGHGHDFFMHFRRYTLSAEYGISTWFPYYAYWLIYPFASIPHPYGLALWNVLNALGLGWLCRYWRVNPALLALIYPTMYMFGNGQIDGFMAAAMVISFQAHPLIAGFGLVVLSIKPQLTILIGLYVLLNRWHWQLLIIPLIVLGASLLYWGLWIPEWLISLRIASDDVRFTEWNVSYYPYSLILLPLVWYFRRQPRLLLTLTPAIVPYYAIYSLALAFTIGTRWWLFILCWAVSLVYVLGGDYTPLWGLVIIGLVFIAYQDTQQDQRVKNDQLLPDSHPGN
ncbi:MAG: glycosyltransferase family 87 protein [Chloroflexota bacterium]